MLPTTLAILASLLLPLDDPKPFPGTTTGWEGFRRHDFPLDGGNVIVIEPPEPLPGRPWAWRGEFFGAYPNADVELVRRGWHLVDALDLGHAAGEIREDDDEAPFGLGDDVERVVPGHMAE